MIVVRVQITANNNVSHRVGRESRINYSPQHLGVLHADRFARRVRRSRLPMVNVNRQRVRGDIQRHLQNIARLQQLMALHLFNWETGKYRIRMCDASI